MFKVIIRACLVGNSLRVRGDKITLYLTTVSPTKCDTGSNPVRGWAEHLGLFFFNKISGRFRLANENKYTTLVNGGSTQICIFSKRNVQNYICIIMKVRRQFDIFLLIRYFNKYNLCK